MFRDIIKLSAATTACVLLLLLQTAGCSGNAPETEPAATEETQAAPPSPEPTRQAETASSPALVTAEGETPGVRVELRQLQRTSGDTLTLRLTMINDSEQKLEFGYDFTDPNYNIKDYNSIGGIHLIDADAKKKYFVVRDTENRCVCSTDLKAIGPHSSANMWAKFPAPPEEVEKISVVIPHFEPLDDVSISR